MKSIIFKEKLALLGASVLLVGTLGLVSGCSGNSQDVSQPKNSSNVEKAQKEQLTEKEYQQLKEQFITSLENSNYTGFLTEKDFDKIVQVIKMDETMISDPLYYTYIYSAQALLTSQYSSQGKPSTIWYRIQDSDQNYNLVYDEIYKPLEQKNKTIGSKVYEMTKQPIGKSVKADVQFLLSYPLSFWLDPEKSNEEKQMRIAILDRVNEYKVLSEKELENIAQSSLSK